MSIEEQIEIVKIVEELNNEWEDTILKHYNNKFQELTFMPFSISLGYSNIYHPIVLFFDMPIWGGEDDNRDMKKDEDDIDTDEYEDYKTYFLKCAHGIIKKLNIGFKLIKDDEV